jgi:hypothetical protein
MRAQLVDLCAVVLVALMVWCGVWVLWQVEAFLRSLFH